MEKLERFSIYLERKNIDNVTRKFFNEVYDEAENREAFINQLQTEIWETATKHRIMVEQLDYFFRLKRGILRNVKQLRRIRNA